MTALEAVLRRDRAVVVAALAIVTALAWADLVWLANDMWMGGMAVVVALSVWTAY